MSPFLCGLVFKARVPVQIRNRVTGKLDEIANVIIGQVQKIIIHSTNNGYRTICDCSIDLSRDRHYIDNIVECELTPA